MAAWCKIDFSDYGNPLSYAKKLYLNGTEVTNLEIPSGITSIKDRAFHNCTSLVSVSIPSGVTSIGIAAFYGCSSLTSVSIPEGITSIAGNSFNNCSLLTSITIPSSVASIGGYAFGGCSSLASVNITDLTAWCNIDFVNLYSNPLTFANRLYLNGTEVTTLAIPDGITAIKNYAFSRAKKVTSVSIPNSVTSIGISAFERCDLLSSITVPNSVTSIGNSVFTNCSKLASVKIVDLAAWCNIDFGNADSNPLNYAHHLTLNDAEVTALTVPNTITEIKQYAFYGCTGLTSVTIPEDVASVGTKAFYGCSNVTTFNSQMESPSGATVATDAFPSASTATLNIPCSSMSEYSSLTNPYWGFAEENVKEVAYINLSSLGYATYCCPKALDFSAVDGLDAYVATSFNSGELTATQRDKIPANTGVMLKGTAGSYILPEYTGTVSPVATNLFVGINEKATLDVTTTKDDVEYTNLVLAVVGGDLGFYNLIESGILAAHKAYLPIATSLLNTLGESKKVNVNIVKGGTTDIKAVEVDSNSENTIYNLQGQKVQNPERGIYIINGKKTYIK